MKRREALKTLAVASGGLITLPSWALRWNVGSLPSGTSFFTTDEQRFIATVTDTIIPPGDKDPGALSVGVDKFFVQLIEHCFEKGVRENVRKRLKALDDSARKASGSLSSDCSQQQHKVLLLAFSESDDESDNDFFNLIKEETVRGFRTLQVVMENYPGYQLMADHYNGFATATRQHDG